MCGTRLRDALLRTQGCVDLTHTWPTHEQRDFENQHTLNFFFSIVACILFYSFTRSPTPWIKQTDFLKNLRTYLTFLTHYICAIMTCSRCGTQRGFRQPDACVDRRRHWPQREGSCCFDHDRQQSAERAHVAAQASRQVHVSQGKVRSTPAKWMSCCLYLLFLTWVENVFSFTFFRWLKGCVCTHIQVCASSV